MSVNEMQFGFMPERGTIDFEFIYRMMQEEYHAKGKKLYMCLAYSIVDMRCRVRGSRSAA